MFESAVHAGLKRWVVAGSCFEYGKSGERYTFIPPDAPLEPTSSYPASKAAASIVLSALAIEAGASLLIGRIFQVYGEGEQDSRFWPSLRRAALSGLDFAMTMGDQVRDFVPVQQVAKYFVDALYRADLDIADVKIENVGSGHPQTLREFAEYWWTTWNAPGTLLLGQISCRPNEIMRYVPSF
jgi:nucleoside-diphosphate-sugar epimerase